MGKQTAVQWLFDQLVPNPTLTIREVEIMMEAKAMEKRQIVDAVDGFPIKNRSLNGEDYYNKTYKQDNE